MTQIQFPENARNMPAELMSNLVILAGLVSLLAQMQVNGMTVIFHFKQLPANKRVNKFTANGKGKLSL